MKKQNRLKKRKEFNWIFKNGVTHSVSLLALVTTESKLKDFKIGYSVSKKIGNAVTRNKIKRQLKSILLKFENNITPKHNYIFVARIGIEKASFTEIENSIKELLKKSGLFKELWKNF